MTQIKLNSSLDSVSSNVSVNPSVLFEKEKMVNQESGKVLLLTGITGLGYNLAPHFGMYQILNYMYFSFFISIFFSVQLYNSLIPPNFTLVFSTTRSSSRFISYNNI